MQKHFFGFAVWLLAAAIGICASGCDDKKEPVTMVGEATLTIQNVSGKVTFVYDETKNFTTVSEGVEQTRVEVPDGWYSTYANNVLTVNAPSKNDASAQTSGTVSIQYAGSDGVSKTASFDVEVVEGTTPPRPVEGGFDITYQVASTTLSYHIVPDNPDATYVITLDLKSTYDTFGNDADFMAADVAYWKNEYGDDLSPILGAGEYSDVFEGLPANQQFILCAYYCNEDGSVTSGFSKRFFSTDGTTPGGDPVSEYPDLELGYEIGDGEPFGYPGKAVVVAYVTPNDKAADWYYGMFPIENNSLSDEELINGLMQYEELHAQNVMVYPYDWGAQKLLCGFALDAEGNKGPLHRKPLTVSTGVSSDASYDDYLGEWVVSGRNAVGDDTSFAITFEQNVYNDSYNVFGFAGEDRDRTFRAPVKVAYDKGMLRFKEQLVLGIDSAENWMAFVGIARNLSNPSMFTYFCEEGKAIATGGLIGNTITVDWQSSSTEIGMFKYFAFAYGYLDAEENFVFYRGDDLRYAASDMRIVKKGGAAAAAMAALPADVSIRRAALR